MDSYERIIDIFIGILILFLFPLLYFGLKQDAITQTIVDVETEELVDEIRGKGYLSKDRYDKYLDDLSGTGLLYDIEFEQRQKIMEPEYRFRTLEEIIEDQNNAYTGTNTYHFHPIETFPPDITDPIDNSGLTMNTETNESVLAAAVNLPADPGHVHTDECYRGHKHQGNQTFIHTHTHTSSCRWYESAVYHNVTCKLCGANYDWYLCFYYMDPDTYRITEYPQYSYGASRCIFCDGRNLSIIVNHEYSFSCGYNTDDDNDRFNDKIPNDIMRNYECYYPQVKYCGNHYSGCYRYHSYYTIDNDRAGYGDFWFQNHFIGYMRSNGLDKYCEIPKFYSFQYVDEDTDKTLGTLSFAAKWKNGQIVFECVGGSGIGVKETPDVNINKLDALSCGPGSFSRYAWGYEDTDGNVTVASFGGTFKICEYERSESNRWVPICGFEEDATLVCDKKVKTLVPTHPVQAVYVGEALITTAVATFVDGSTKTVVCSTNFTATEPVSNRTVTLSYLDELGSNNTCTITVTVVPKSKVCVNGHTYNLTNEGLDPGCPYCREYVSNLRIEYPVNGSIDIYRGTSLSDNGVTLLATYMDGHTKLLQMEYVDNFDKFYVGMQHVTLSYRGKYCYLTVNNKRNVKLCPICSRYYELYPDDTDPGCPHCALSTPIFTGNVLEYYDKRYMDEILSELYGESGVYYFSNRDYLIVTVKNIRGSWGSRLLSNILHGLDGNNINVIKGGYIRENGNEYE